MSEKKWTPGPWAVEYSAEGSIVCEIQAGLHVTTCRRVVGDARHDANLIAAAPELYEALEALMPRNTGSGQSMDWGAYADAVSKAKAAMAKARGEQ